jgi:trk system potassium uptake protein
VGKQVGRITLPAGSRLITVMREGQAQMADGATELRAGDQVLAVLEPGKEDELRNVLLKER